MSRRDELIKLIGDDFDADASPRSTADRILALILPETPEEGMVEAMARDIDQKARDATQYDIIPGWGEMEPLYQERCRVYARAAWTAARKWRMG